MNNLSDIEKINAFYNFMREYKGNDSLVTIILEFCEQYDILEEEIGDLISRDQYLSDFILRDCKKRGIIKTDKKPKSEIENW